MHIFPQRQSLQELGNEIFKLVSYSATSEQWAEWLRVPLEHAVARGNLDLVDTLLQAGADGSAGWRGCRGRTLLHAAAVGGNPDVLTALLGAGAQPDVNVVSLSPKRSALYVAAICGHTHVARRLILAGADVWFKDPVDHCTVLHEAACWGNGQLVNDLLIGGANPISDFGPCGSTPLHQAAASDQAEIISALLLRGANKDATDHNGTTPLMWAADDGRLAAVKTLLAAGADLNIRDDARHAALDYAAINGHLPIITAILRHGADVNSRDGVVGLSALHKAGMENQAGAVDTLVKAGAAIDLKSNYGATPLMKAALYSQGKAMLALLKRGAAVMARGNSGETALHEACVGNCSGLDVAVDLLLRWGADDAALDDDDETPAGSSRVPSHLAYLNCSQEEYERARLVLSRGPAYRAWRRRSWLVVLRSRASKSRIVGHGGDGDGPVINHVAAEACGCSGESEACKAAKTEGSSRAECGVRGQTCSSSSGGGVAGEESERWDLNDVVTWLLGLELEGVVRTVVGYI